MAGHFRCIDPLHPDASATAIKCISIYDTQTRARESVTFGAQLQGIADEEETTKSAKRYAHGCKHDLWVAPSPSESITAVCGFSIG
jgi:hypothetical protein